MQQYKEQAKEISNIQKLCPITECISQINNTDKDHAEYLNIVMPKYNLIEHSKNYTKTGHLWQYHIDIPHDSELNLLLNWSANCVITNSTGTETFEITYTSLYVPVVALSAEGNTEPQQQLNSRFKRTIN